MNTEILISSVGLNHSSSSSFSNRINQIHQFDYSATIILERDSNTNCNKTNFTQPKIKSNCFWQDFKLVILKPTFLYLHVTTKKGQETFCLPLCPL